MIDNNVIISLVLVSSSRVKMLNSFLDQPLVRVLSSETWISTFSNIWKLARVWNSNT